ncbi:Hypothetical protein MexAM1_META1p5153 [Methylorubrum extorquens AM1]|uniref:Uncharacterized protein n=1 Tax=Methylorubrum extorquens (strain ATCC 14718 / DSM 1338 / JCM 2805 / NCIMB 9133 / AM1) TaxID=272630 RepID=C5AUX0_METEA|nr:Hypothetical protein MexAM1_META1p5153 [Methylorubrum extorquens AM1]
MLPSLKKVSHSTPTVHRFVAGSRPAGGAKLFQALGSLRFPHFTVRWNERESDGCAVLIVCDPPDRLC